MFKLITDDFRKQHEEQFDELEEMTWGLESNNLDVIRARIRQLDWWPYSIQDVMIELAFDRLDNQGDEGGEGYLFTAYIREHGMFGVKTDDEEKFWNSDNVQAAGHAYDFPMLYHRVLYGMECVQAYAIKTIAEEFEIDPDVLGIAYQARSFELHKKHDQDIVRVMQYEHDFIFKLLDLNLDTLKILLTDMVEPEPGPKFHQSEYHLLSSIIHNLEKDNEQIK